MSNSVLIGPQDPRCRYWAKVIRAGTPLPLPSSVNGASDIPGPYARNGDEELLEGDVMIEGEANHHRRPDRGWSYRVTASRGELVYVRPCSAVKAQMKAAGMAPGLLTGSGDVAACVRIAHGLREGWL